MLGTLPGPLGSWARLLGPDLAGVSLRRLGMAGQGSWACLGLRLTLWHSQNTLTHTPSGTLMANPESAVFGDFRTF